MDHFINFKNAVPDYLEGIINQALEIKHNPAKYSCALKGRKLYLLFQKTSTRTALSFALGMTASGGEYFMQNWQDSNFAVGEIQDEARYVACCVDIILARLKTHAAINLMAQYSSVPVINGCCDMYHPCQAIADLLTLKELFGTLKIKLLYVGVRNNVLNSLMESLPLLGGELYAAIPVVNSPSRDDELYKKALKTGRFFDLGGGNPSLLETKKIAKEVDVIYTDTWVDMEFINDPQYADLKKERMEKLLPFQINAGLLQNSRALVMHDMPMHAGYEIDRQTIEAHIQTILRQAANKKYAAQSILLTLLNS
jgi:ornithine carbamoyltransferase